MKKHYLVIAVIAAFFVGYGVTAVKAWPGVPDRARWHGYFKDQRQVWGKNVWNTGIPDWVNSADSFIAFTEDKLAAGPDTQDGVGAAFIIQTMMGLDRTLPPSPAQIADWEGRVRQAGPNVLWYQWTTQTVNSFYQPGPIDDAYYYQTNTSVSIVFRDSVGNWLYVLRRECANPQGTANALPAAPRYTISGRTTVQPTAIPGETVTFSNYLRNDGPDYAANINWNDRDPANGAIYQQGTVGLWPGEINVANELFTIPIDAAFGSTYCRYIDFAPAVNGAGSGNGPPACVLVVARYSLQPLVTADAITAQQNDTINFTYIVNNSGPTRSETVNCSIIGNTRPSGYTPLPQQDIDRTSDPGYVPPSTSCPTVFSIGTTTIATEAVNVGGLAPGQQICRSLDINPRDQNGGPRTSAETCVVIAKTPYAHFMGNDVWAGGAFAGDPTNPSCTTPPGNQPSKIQTVAPHRLQSGGVAGSLSEYGALAQGLITNFGTASQPLGTWLTFSNMNNDGRLGFFNQPEHCINNYITKYQNTPVDLGMSLASSIDVGNQSSGTWHITGNKDFKGIVPAKAKQVYLVDGSVTITDNITYKTGDIVNPPTYDNIDDIPSLVIIARGGINVIGNVGQLDGVYVTPGVFHTCDDHTGTLTISICNAKLVINGAVIANQLNLRRTYGADGNDDTARKRPAELFNFNPEVYLRNALSDSTGGVIKVMEQKDLPPRY